MEDFKNNTTALNSAISALKIAANNAETALKNAQAALSTAATNLSTYNTNLTTANSNFNAISSKIDGWSAGDIVVVGSLDIHRIDIEGEKVINNIGVRTRTYSVLRG